MLFAIVVTGNNFFDAVQRWTTHNEFSHHDCKLVTVKKWSYLLDHHQHALARDHIIEKYSNLMENYQSKWPVNVLGLDMSIDKRAWNKKRIDLLFPLRIPNW